MYDRCPRCRYGGFLVQVKYGENGSGSKNLPIFLLIVKYIDVSLRMSTFFMPQ